MNNQLAVLCHGFIRTPGNMNELESYLIEKGFLVEKINLTIHSTLDTFQNCVKLFTEQYFKIIKKYPDIDKVFFIGHSLGGVIIRQFLSENYVEKLGKVVTIGSPNKIKKEDLFGIWDVVLISSFIFKSYSYLLFDKEIPEPKNPDAQIGVIAGHKLCKLGYLFPSKPSDGLIMVE